MNTPESPSCETYEILISTWVDVGLERDEQRRLLDHLVRCADCRAFYADSRALEGLVEVAGHGAAAEAPSPEVWERIESRAAEPADAVDGGRGWGWRAAAALLIGGALAFLPWPASEPAGQTGRGVEVVLEENRGDMTESRFLELAAEILRADRRYHFAMQEVMERVVDDEWRAEGATSEGITEDRKRDSDDGGAARVRV